MVVLGSIVYSVGLAPALDQAVRLPAPQAL
jgi:hypothetical protein